MAKRKAVDLRLEVAESNAAVDVKLLRDGKAVIHSTDGEPPLLRVQGFSSPKTVEQLLAMADQVRTLSPEDWLSVYVKGRRKELDDCTKELRRLMRKMAAAVEAARAAESALAILQEQHTGNGASSS